MEIQSFYYNEDYKMLYTEYLIDDLEYSIELDFDEIQKYCPYVISEEDLIGVDRCLVIDIVNQYISENNT